MLLLDYQSLVVTVILAAAVAQSSDRLSGWFGPSPFGYCYYAQRYNLLTFSQAQRFCASLGAKLPSFGHEQQVDPKQEFQFVTQEGDKILRMSSALAYYPWQRPDAEMTSRPHWGDSFWLSYTDELTEGTFVNADGQKLTWANWNQADNEPRGGRSTNCVNAVKSENWKWDDNPCSRKIDVICQKRPICKLEHDVGVDSGTTASAGETLAVTCQPGFRLVGQPNVTCQCDGTFDYSCTMCIAGWFHPKQELDLLEMLGPFGGLQKIVGYEMSATLTSLPTQEDAIRVCKCASKVALAVVLTMLTVASTTLGLIVLTLKKPHVVKRYLPFV